MKQLRYIAILLLIMAAIIIPINATENFITDPLGDYHLGGNPCTEGVVTIFTNTNVTYSGAGTKLYHFYGYCSGGTRNSAGSEEIIGDAGTITLQKAAGTNYLHYLCDSGATARCYNYFIYNTTPAPTPIINFTATPTTGPAALSVTLSVVNYTETNGTISWTFGDGQSARVTTESTTHVYQNAGIYSVRMDYFGKYSKFPGQVQINDYINVTAPNVTSVTHAVARDLYTGFAINGAQVDMYDVENSSWTNTTTTNGEGSITTLLGHTINIWGSAIGYEDDNLIGVPEVNGGYYSLLLTPTNITTYNTTPGNLTLAVTVQDLQIPHQTLSGAQVTAAWGSQYASGTSNAAGSVFFTVPNNTAIHLSAFKSGYASGSSTHITGTANGGSTMETAIVYIGTDYITPTVTATTGPGGTVPQTVDPYPCIGDGSAQDTANCQRKQGSMAADLISYGPDLVKFFIMLTFIGGLLLITKR